MKRFLIAILAFSLMSLISAAGSERGGGRGNQVSPETAVEEALKRIILPEVSFRQAHIQDVIAFLIESSIEQDPEGRGVNIVLNLNAGPSAREGAKRQQQQTWLFGPAVQAQPVGPQQEVPLVTFSARRITLHETLRIVTQLTNLKYRVQGNVVFVVPHDAPDGEIIVRIYDVLPVIETRVRQLSQELQLRR